MKAGAGAPRRILLADADAFFVAVARRVDPEGAGRARLVPGQLMVQFKSTVTDTQIDAVLAREGAQRLRSFFTRGYLLVGFAADRKLFDVVMPDMNGRKLAEEALKRRPDLRVLYTTGYTRNAIVHHGILDPDVQLLVKPFTIEALAQKLEEVLSNDMVDQSQS